MWNANLALGNSRLSVPLGTKKKEIALILFGSLPMSEIKRFGSERMKSVVPVGKGAEKKEDSDRSGNIPILLLFRLSFCKMRPTVSLPQDRCRRTEEMFDGWRVCLTSRDKWTAENRQVDHFHAMDHPLRPSGGRDPAGKPKWKRLLRAPAEKRNGIYH